MTYILITLMVVPVFLFMMFTPYLTRKTESFGVSIPEEIYYSDAVKNMRKQYVKLTSILGLVTIAVIILILYSFEHSETIIGLSFGIALVLYTCCSFLVYLKFHREMNLHKQQGNWTEEKETFIVMDTAFRNQKLHYSNFWFLISFGLAIITMVFTFQHYEQIPGRIAMHYNFQGEVTNWAEKSYRSLLLMPMMQIYLTALFLLINTMIVKAKQQIDAENPERSKQQNIIFRRRWSAYIIISSIALTCLFAFSQATFIYPISKGLIAGIPIVISVGMILGVLILSYTTGQGGSRIKIDIGTTSDSLGVTHDDDRYWKLGMFYFNKEDPTLFIEKRFGIGWTINCARPIAWVIFIIPIVLAIAIPLLLGI